MEIKKIIIIGNSLAALKVVENIRREDAESEITQFTLDSSLPYNRYLLADWVAQEIEKDRVYSYSLEDYKKLNIRNIEDKKIVRVNLRKNYITTDQKEKLDYDHLIIADLAVDKIPEIKGNNRSGVVNPRRIEDANQIIQAMPFSETVVMQSADILGVKMAIALLRKGKEVLFVFSDNNPLKSFMEQEDWDRLKSAMESSGIRLMPENTIIEILGEGDVKAVKLSSGKVFSCQMVVLGDVREDLRLFKDTGLDFDDKILVNDKFQTTFNNVFAVNGICNFNKDAKLENYENYSSVLDEQGKIVASCIIGEQSDVPGQEVSAINMPIFKSSFEVADSLIKFLGYVPEVSETVNTETADLAELEPKEN